MRRRLAVYVVVFNLLAVIAALPAFAIACNWSFGTRRVLMEVLSPVARPPLVLTSLFADALQALGVPWGSISFGSWAIAPIGCVVYYALLFVVFLPVGLGRRHTWHTRRGFLIWWGWSTLAVAVVLAHLALLVHGLVLMR